MGETIKLPARKQAKFCIVDDDEFVVNMIVSTLNAAGLAPAQIFHSAEKFLEQSQNLQKEFYLVISDVLLPGISGFELCKKIKDINKNTPVILISGYDIEDIYTKVLGCGADDFLAKPFNPIELTTRVKLLLAKHEREVSAQEDSTTDFIRDKERNFPYIGDKIGNYVITDTIGWGRTSMIFKATRTDNKEILSLKILAAQAAEMKDMINRFVNEINIMERIRHPNIVQFLDRGYHNSIPYVVMEYIKGLDLEEYIITKGRVPIQTVLAIAHGIASAIAEIHRNNIIHRDIKLKNIIYDVKCSAPKLIDFGIACAEDTVRITRDGFIVGTPLYMAPEIFEGEDATVKSDLYSFGATIYQLATGSPPFTGETSKELYYKHLNDEPPPMSTFRNDVPVDLENIVRFCLSKKPNYRPESMEIVEARLKQLILTLEFEDKQKN